MSFFKRLFKNKPKSKTQPSEVDCSQEKITTTKEKPKYFDVIDFMIMCYNNYRYQNSVPDSGMVEMEVLMLFGDKDPEEKIRLLDIEWKKQSSLLEQKIFCFNKLDELGVLKALDKWQVIERYISVMDFASAKNYISNNLTEEDYKNNDVVLSLIRFYRISGDYDKAYALLKGVEETLGDQLKYKMEYINFHFQYGTPQEHQEQLLKELRQLSTTNLEKFSNQGYSSLSCIFALDSSLHTLTILTSSRTKLIDRDINYINLNFNYCPVYSFYYSRKLFADGKVKDALELIIPCYKVFKHNPDIQQYVLELIEEMGLRSLYKEDVLEIKENIKNYNKQGSDKKAEATEEHLKAFYQDLDVFTARYFGNISLLEIERTEYPDLSSELKDVYGEWASITEFSRWDKKSVIFSHLDKTELDKLNVAQTIERWTMDRYTQKAIDFIEASITEEDLINIDVLLAMSKAYRCYNNIDRAIDLAKKAYTLDSENIKTKTSLASALHLSSKQEDRDEAHTLIHQVLNSTAALLEGQQTVDPLGLFMFNKIWIDSSIIVANMVESDPSLEAYWDILSEEYYYCPHFRLKHGVFLMSKKGDQMSTFKALAKFKVLADEFPFFKTGLETTISVMKQFSEQMNDVNFMKEDIAKYTEALRNIS